MCIITSFPEVSVAGEGSERSEGPSSAQGRRELWWYRVVVKNVDFRVGRGWVQIPALCNLGQVISSVCALDPI